jgi:hypothetical protein
MDVASRDCQAKENQPSSLTGPCPQTVHGINFNTLDGLLIVYVLRC